MLARLDLADGHHRGADLLRERVTAARLRQAERFKGTRLLANADMGPANDLLTTTLSRKLFLAQMTC
jgi:hypothetical protein